MAVLRINGKKVDVDIENEMRIYPWERDRWSESKLIACSPFRAESHPSFFVNLETGGWADSGGFGKFERGNLMSLIGHLRGTTPYEAGEYLIDKYGALYEVHDDSIPLKVETPSLWTKDVQRHEINVEHVIQHVSPYMSSRGISTEVQRMFSIGYGKGFKGFTAIPWAIEDGRIANVKYRRTKGRQFYYEPNATPIRYLVYGLNIAKRYDEVVIVEGEIDAMSWWTIGVPSIALGTSHINSFQAELIKREGFKTVYLGGDNDDQGVRMNNRIINYLKGRMTIKNIDYKQENDANDVLTKLGRDFLSKVYNESTTIKTINI